MDDHVGCGYGSETEIVVSTLIQIVQPGVELWSVIFFIHVPIALFPISHSYFF
jgi:hypothetical protein